MLASMPTRKITAAAIGGAVATIVATLIQAVTGAQPPPGLEGAVSTLVALAAGYFVKDASSPPALLPPPMPPRANP